MAGPEPIDIPLRWIDDAAPPRLPLGATFGVPLPRGEVTDPGTLSVVADDGTAVASQTWPLATWPDGSAKWAGVALAATDRPVEAYRVLRAESAPDAAALSARIDVTESDDAVAVSTGPLSVEIPRSGDRLVSSVAVGGTVVAVDGRLVSSRQDRPEPDHAGRSPAVGVVESVAVEQSGPVRAVVRIEGAHRDETGRTWLPFTVRLVFAAGARTFRLVHTFVWDGDPERDFLTSLGLRFRVPLRAASVDRHIRFAGADGGVMREAVRGVTGLRRDPGSAVREAQLEGRATPPAETWESGVADLLRWVPQWPDYTLRQLSPNAFSIAKRTAPNRSWVHVAHGTRSDGYVYLGDPAGGLGVGLSGFWQSAPTGLDIRDAHRHEGELTVWLWAPDAPPMDVRFYHDGLGEDTYVEQLEALEITYEDYEDDLGSATGVARTHEIEITGYAATPGLDELASDIAHVARGPRLCATPDALHTAGVFGDWDLVARDSAPRAALEERLDQIVDFYLGQVEQRGWYGFWDYGDVMHTYDDDRHVWRYDIGGYAWDNSELATDLWLWTTFLRTGRADVFRMAEAMARHTGDVDAYHSGPLAGFGSRHNVQHWGCGCKQPRIGSATFRRPHYYLTADEHSRDLLVAQRDTDQAYRGIDPWRKARPDEFPPPAPRLDRIMVGLGTEWGTLAAGWLADWEITGNEHSRDRLLNTMADIGSWPRGFLHGHARYDLERGRLVEPYDGVDVSHLNAIFGLVELCAELVELVDVPGFRDAWLDYCRLYISTPERQRAELGQEIRGNLFPQWHSRLTAYAAAHDGDHEAADRAWAAFFAGGEVTPVDLGPGRRVTPPEVLAPVDELPISTNDAAQSSLATIQNLALIGDRLR
ncbi:Tat pathway signal sequence domain protein [Microbacterium thalassium]|uniref:Tat pathway signal sequence domain protein n=1 Tax=Microbacterium thalassium TaxID=362649 RepID=A0A7X0KTX1_9MICO|nr:Tat pathway signal sequence domain protein [Microbacterium thalassium]MBB6390570.1 hypothetical protein [Microbacterium thalassium]GLK25681.1 hypothetical protein GCM10017607_30000 [Microbacterium thalassium]